MWRNVDWWTVTVVSNEPAACIFCVEDGGKTTHRNGARIENFSSLKTVILYYILPVQNKLHLPECLNSSTEYVPQRFNSFNIISRYFVTDSVTQFLHASVFYFSVRHYFLCSRFLYTSFFLSFFAILSSFPWRCKNLISSEFNAAKFLCFSHFFNPVSVILTY